MQPSPEDRVNRVDDGRQQHRHDQLADVVVGGVLGDEPERLVAGEEHEADGEAVDRL